jgi:hypothetical protein
LHFILANCAAAATISGTVQISASKPIRASLTIHDLSTGTYSLSGVPAGKYEVCVDAPQENVLDPCIRTPGGAPTITVGASDISNHSIAVATGYLLSLRVNDPTAVLPKSGATGSALSLKVITAGNRVINFRLLSTDSQGRNQYVLIPFNQAVMLVTESSSLTLSDGQNNPLPNNSQRYPVRVPVGGSWPAITVNVASATATRTPVANALKP